jgi:hypothetical protein
MREAADEPSTVCSSHRAKPEITGSRGKSEILEIREIERGRSGESTCRGAQKMQAPLLACCFLCVRNEFLPRESGQCNGIWR